MAACACGRSRTQVLVNRPVFLLHLPSAVSILMVEEPQDEVNKSPVTMHLPNSTGYCLGGGFHTLVTIPQYLSPSLLYTFKYDSSI